MHEGFIVGSRLLERYLASLGKAMLRARKWFLTCIRLLRSAHLLIYWKDIRYLDCFEYIICLRWYTIDVRSTTATTTRRAEETDCSITNSDDLCWNWCCSCNNCNGCCSTHQAKEGRVGLTIRLLFIVLREVFIHQCTV